MKNPTALQAILFGLLLNDGVRGNSQLLPTPSDLSFVQMLQEPTDKRIEPMLAAKTDNDFHTRLSQIKEESRSERLEDLAHELDYSNGVATRSMRDFTLKFLLDPEYASALTENEK